MGQIASVACPGLLGWGGAGLEVALLFRQHSEDRVAGEQMGT